MHLQGSSGNILNCYSQQNHHFWLGTEFISLVRPFGLNAVSGWVILLNEWVFAQLVFI